MFERIYYFLGKLKGEFLVLKPSKTFFHLSWNYIPYILFTYHTRNIPLQRSVAHAITKIKVSNYFPILLGETLNFRNSKFRVIQNSELS